MKPIVASPYWTRYATTKRESMLPQAIVYSSKTGFTKRYAELLSRKLNLSLYAYDAAKEALPKGAPIIFLGWIRIGSIVDLKKALKRFSVVAACAVGDAITCDETDLRKRNKIPEETLLFYLQGGLDFAQLSKPEKALMKVVTSALVVTEKDRDVKRSLKELRKNGGDFVREEALASIAAWYKNALSVEK